MAEHFYAKSIELCTKDDHILKISRSNFLNNQIETCKFKEAFNLLQLEVSKNSRSHLTYSKLGYLYFLNQNIKIALAYFKLALTLFPSSFDALSNVALILGNQNKEEFAIKICNNIFKYVPNHEKNICNLAQINFRKSNLKESKRIFEEFIEQNKKRDNIDAIKDLLCNKLFLSF